MALKTIYKTDDGPVDAYYRISELRFQYEKNYQATADKNVVFYLDALSWGDRVSLMDDGNYLDNLCGPYSITVSEGVAWDTLVDKAYEHLKTLEKFEDATDCQI